MAQNRKMPSKPPICREWENEPEMIQKKKRFGWDKLPEHSCWRCGKDGYTERAHIHSHCFNRDDKPSNLHLLCGSCHNTSEPLTGWEEGHFYYEWFNTYDDKYWACKIVHYYSKYIENNSDVIEEEQDDYQKRLHMWYDDMMSIKNQENQTQMLIPEPPLLRELLQEMSNER